MFFFCLHCDLGSFDLVIAYYTIILSSFECYLTRERLDWERIVTHKLLFWDNTLLKFKGFLVKILKIGIH